MILYTGARKENSFDYKAPIIKVNVADNYMCEIVKYSWYSASITYNLIEGTNYLIYSARGGERYIKLYDKDRLGSGAIKTINTKELPYVYYALATTDVVLLFREDGYLYVYNIDVTKVENNSTVEANEKIYIGGYKVQAFLSNLSNLFVETDTAELRKVTFDKNMENIVALKYKEQYFYKIKPEELSAGTGDVKKGKTFIGVKGTPEVGTLEV